VFVLQLYLIVNQATCFPTSKPSKKTVIILFRHLVFLTNFHALKGVKSVRFDGIHILKEDEAIIKSKLASNAIGPADVDKYALAHFCFRSAVTCNTRCSYIRELAQASYTKYYIDRNKLTVSNDTVARYRARSFYGTCMEVQMHMRRNQVQSIYDHTLLADTPQRLNFLLQQRISLY
jgi:hypothetical protein